MKSIVKNVVYLCSIIFIITGCVSQPNNEELMNADYGYSIRYMK